MQVGALVGGVAQDIARVQRQLAQQGGRDRQVVDVRLGQVGREREPDAGDGPGEMELPAEFACGSPPAVPARLAPVGLDIEGDRRQQVPRAILDVPDAAEGAQQGAVEDNGTPMRGPDTQQADQEAT